MHVDWWIVALVVLGHCCLLVWLTNVSHALGVTERLMSRVNGSIATAWLIVTGVLAWSFSSLSWQDWPTPVFVYGAICLAIAVVGLPLATLRLRMRRLPAGMSGRTAEVKLASDDQAAHLIGTGKHSWMLHLPRNEFLVLQRSEWRVELASVPAACDGLSIVQVSDLHLAPCFDKRYFEAVLDAAADSPADVVVFTGDLVEHASAIAWIEPLLSRLRGRLGAFAILGNHDYIFDISAIRRGLESAGFADLDGRWTSITFGGATLALGGTSAPWGPALDFSGTSEADFRIVLSHTPDLFPQASAHGIDLVLAGHNHGGQVRLPIVGPVFMPSRYSRRYDRGFFRRGRSLMYVNQGIAGKHPVRYGCLPEITRFVLQRARSSRMLLPAIRAEAMETGHTPVPRPGDRVH
jgi:uncharacterized protein